MPQAQYFTVMSYFSEPWHLPFFIAVLALAGISSWIFKSRLKAQIFDQANYRPDLAWLRAVLYFCFTTLIAIFSGVTDAIINRPLVSDGQLQNPMWWTGAGICALLIIVAYGYIWAIGTFTDGRKWHPVSTSIFGVMWGISQAQLFLSFWALLELLQLNIWWTCLLTGTVISIYNGNWQQFYWDIKVSPPHNYPEWNVRKVLLCHVPNLLLTLPFFALYGNVQLYIAFQASALLLSSHRMHFPHWADDYHPGQIPTEAS